MLPTSCPPVLFFAQTGVDTLHRRSKQKQRKDGCNTEVRSLRGGDRATRAYPVPDLHPGSCVG